MKRRIYGALALILVSLLYLLAFTWVASPSLAAPAEAATGFRFISWGDTKSATKSLSTLSDQAVTLQPALTIYTGDLESSGFTQAGMDAWKAAMNGQLTGDTTSNGLFDRTFPVRGNHDSSNTAGWQGYYDLRATAARVGAVNYTAMAGQDDLTYSFDYGNAHFAGVDVLGGAGQIKPEQITWLDGDLAAAEGRGLTHAFIYFHGPIYCVGGSHCSTSERVAPLPTSVQNLIEMLNRHPIVSATFHGHEHTYAYTYLDSTRIPASGSFEGVTHPFHQFVTGSAGAGPDSCNDNRCDYNMVSNGFITVDVSGSTLTVSWYAQGNTKPVNTLTLNKAGGPTATPPSATPTAPGVTPTRTPTPQTGEIDISVCDPSHGPFSLNITNPYFPLPVGGVSVIQDSSLKVQISVLNQTEVVAGVTTRVVEEREWENNQLVEVSNNWFVQAPNGTVCYYGEWVDEYEDGQIVGHGGSWRAGEGQNRPGIIMPANPAVGQTYYQEFAPGVAEDRANHIRFETFTTPAGTFYNVLYVEESPPSTKRYAPGVGMIYDDGAVLTSTNIRVTPTPTSTPVFADVPATHLYYQQIEALYREGYTAGCGTNPLRYCPDQAMNRAESAVFVERGIHGVNVAPPPPASARFADLSLSSWAAKWAEALYLDGYTAGCGLNPLIYCPWQGHTRAEAAVFYLRMLHQDPGYQPPAFQGLFSDVPATAWYARWAEEAYRAGLIPACGQDPLRYCPDGPLTRGLAAYMMVQAKQIPLP